MGQISVTWGNEIELKRKKQQNQAVLDNTELNIDNEESSLDLTDLVMVQAEEIENLKTEIEKIKNGGK